MQTSAQQLVEQQKQLQNRVATQQGRLSDHQERYEKAKQDMELRFGTSDVGQLRTYYKSLNEHRQSAMQMRQQLNILVDKSLSYLERGEVCPADLVNTIKEQTAQLAAFVKAAPTFGTPSEHQSSPATQSTAASQARVDAEDFHPPKESNVESHQPEKASPVVKAESTPQEPTQNKTVNSGLINNLNHLQM